MKEYNLLRGVSCLLIAILATGQSRGGPADPITIVGSSTVYPFSALVAEHFAKSGPFTPPVVRSGSTAAGFRLFCAGAGAGTPDVTTASRPISEAERTNCAKNGVQKIAEIRIGYDSLVVASTVKVPTFNITLEQLWRAAAAVVTSNGRLIPNPYQNWRDIDPMLPPAPIHLIGPAVGHGTRDAFIELVMEPSCKAARAALPADSRPEEAACFEVRKDGRWTDVENAELRMSPRRESLSRAARHGSAGQQRLCGKRASAGFSLPFARWAGTECRSHSLLYAPRRHCSSMSLACNG